MKILQPGILVLCTLAACIANAAEFYPIEDATVDTEATDLWPISNLIQGPGDGYSPDEPHTKNLAGPDGSWVTDADAGFPADYIEEVRKPVIQLDLGADRTLHEISVWGYENNDNGTFEFSLRFATEAEGGPDGIDGNINYGQSITYNPSFFLQQVDVTLQNIRLFDETVTARYIEFTNEDNFFFAPGDGSVQADDPRLLPTRAGGDRIETVKSQSYR